MIKLEEMDYQNLLTDTEEQIRKLKLQLEIAELILKHSQCQIKTISKASEKKGKSSMKPEIKT